MPRPSAAATASTLRLAEASPSSPLIAFNSCMVLGPTSPPEHPPPPRPLCALLRPCRSGGGLPPTLLLGRLRGSWFTESRSPQFRSRGTLGASRSPPLRPCGPCTAPETRLLDAYCDPPGRRPPSVPLPLGGHVSAAACSVLRPSCGCAPGSLLPSFRHLRISLRHHGLCTPS